MFCMWAEQVKYSGQFLPFPKLGRHVADQTAAGFCMEIRPVQVTVGTVKEIPTVFIHFLCPNQFDCMDS